MARSKGAKALGDQDDGSGALAALAEGAAAEEAAEQGTEAPPADEAKPGDAETEFDRRLNTLFRIAEDAEFESGTLIGDIRDGLLDVVKHRPKPWAQMSQDEQQDLAKTLEGIARVLIRKIVVVVAEQDEVSVTATLKGYSVKGDTFVLKAEAKGDEDTALQLFKLDGHDVVILSADAKRFMSQKKPVTIDPDQRALAFADEAPKDDGKPSGTPAGEAPPTDDSDLAGGDAFHVTTEEDGVTLYFDPTDNSWTDDRSDAPSFPKEMADKLAEEHDAQATAA